MWLQSLYDQHGYLTPEIVREAARPTESLGHLAVFGVGIAEAAEAFYLDRAHKLIQSVRLIQVPQDDKEPLSVRAFHGIPGEEPRSYIYVSTEDLARRPDQLQLARNEANRRIRDAERSLQSLESIAVGPDVRRTRRAIKKIRSAQQDLIAS